MGSASVPLFRRLAIPVGVAASLLLAACVSTTAPTTTTTTTVKGGGTPTGLFAHVPCQRGYASSWLSFDKRQEVVCIHLGTLLTLNLAGPPHGSRWGTAAMARSDKGDLVLVNSFAQSGDDAFTYRGVRPGIDYVHVLKLIPCGDHCINPGPPVPEAQWAIRIVRPSAPPPSPFPRVLRMQKGLQFSNGGHHYPFGTAIPSNQDKWVQHRSGPASDMWGVWEANGSPSVYPAESTDGGADWSVVGPQLATDWAGGSIFYIDKVFVDGDGVVVMVSNAVIDLTTDGGRQWYQYLNGAADWTMASCSAGGVTCLQVRAAGWVVSLPRGSHAVYDLDPAIHEWRRVEQSLS